MKGIYPREPPKRPKRFVGNRAYYHVKDILWIKHEPLLKKFRELKAWTKKWKKAIHKGRHDKIKNFKKIRPTFTYSHLVRERYPDFEDAVRNLNDPLSMLNLFGLAPAIKKSSAAKVNQIRGYATLAKEFLYYISQTRSLRKAFVSIKGIYYEALILGQPVMWLVPHKFVQYMPRDVDYAVMGTFLHFYNTMVRFVNYKLYLMANLEYPPKFVDGNVSSLRVQKAASKVKVNAEPKKIENLEKIIEKVDSDPSSKTEEEKKGDEENEKKMDTEVLEVKKKYLDPRCTLFEGLVFLLNRETPQESLEFIVTAMGGKCIWQQATRKTGIPKTITHQVIDRNAPKGDPPAWELIQPQWVFDCLNVGVRIPVMPYAPGKMCPPHLSPFHDEDSAYEPKQAAVLREWAKMGRNELEELEKAADIDTEEEEKMEKEEELAKLAARGQELLERDKVEQEQPKDKKERGEKRKLEDDEKKDESGKPVKPMHPLKQMKLGIWKEPPQPKKIRRRDLHNIPNLEERKKLLPRKHRYLFNMIERSNKEWHAEGDLLREKRELLEKESAEEEAKEAEQFLEENDPSEQESLEKDSTEKTSLEEDSSEKTSLDKESSEWTSLENDSSEKTSLEKDSSEKTSLEEDLVVEKSLEKENVAVVEEALEDKNSESKDESLEKKDSAASGEELEKKSPPKDEIPQMESETKEQLESES